MHCLLHFQRYHSEGAKVIRVDGYKMVQSMAASIEAMMQHKIDAIKVNTTDWLYICYIQVKYFGTSFQNEIQK